MCTFNSKKLWVKFDRGDGLSYDELVFLRDQTKAALVYLEARGASYNLATTPTLAALRSLEDYISGYERETNRLNQRDLRAAQRRRTPVI